MTLDANFVSAVAAAVGVVVGLAAQAAVLTRRNRLRSRLRHVLELRRDLERESGPGQAMLRQSLDLVAEYCAKELAILESRWVRHALTAGPARLELVISLAGVLVAAGALGTLLSWVADVPGGNAVAIGLVMAAVALVWILRFERGLKRDIALAEIGEANNLRGRWARYSVGINEDVLMAHPADAVRFTRLGMLLYLVPLVTISSFLTFPGLGSVGWMVLVFSPFMLFLTFTINRAMALSRWPPGWSSWLRTTPIILITVLQGLFFSEIVGLRAFAGPIDEKLSAEGVPPNARFLAALDALGDLMSTDARFLTAWWGIVFVIVGVSLLPLVLRLIDGMTNYDREMDRRANEALARHEDFIRQAENSAPALPPDDVDPDDRIDGDDGGQTDR